jgi:hypothetical protein
LTIAGTGGSGNDIVTVGTGGSVQNIRGTVSVENPPSLTALVVDDSGDPVYHTLIHDSFTPAGDSAFGRITGLAPAAIEYEYNDTRTATIRSGSGGVNVLVASSGEPVITLIGNPAGVNTLVGAGAACTWTLTDANSGTLGGSAIGSSVAFSAFQNLTGGAQADTFVMRNGGVASGDVDGGGGMTTLDYSAYSGDVVVNLQTGSATGVGGTVRNIRNVIGTSGSGTSLIVGNGGNLLTVPGTGRSLLIAGPSASVLQAGDGASILIGGVTAYDTDTASLQAILSEWARTDEDYATRVNNLTNGVGVPLLDATTVAGNGGGNVLWGGANLDLFYGNLDSDVTNWDPNRETFVRI